jgi:gamma-glutamylcyclotransferase (GGCT)/AIG2-like uncharacterized protein YtfP
VTTTNKTWINPISEYIGDTHLVFSFVYGTLRPGFGNHRIIAPAVVEAFEDVHTKGDLYASQIPFADFDGDGDITGTLLVLNNSTPRGRAAVDAMIQLEGGYDAKFIPVTTADGHLIHAAALAWHYPAAWHARFQMQPEYIASGDYVHYRTPARRSRRRG